MQEISESQYLKELELFKKNNSQQALNVPNQDEPAVIEVNQPGETEDDVVLDEQAVNEVNQPGVTENDLGQDEPDVIEVNQPDSDQDDACQPQSLSSRIRQSLTSAWTRLKRFFCCLKTAN